MGNIVVAPPNSAVIVTGIRGQKIVLGKCGFALWCVETAYSLSLQIMTITITSEEAETSQGVKLSLKSYAQVKVKSLNPDGSMNIDGKPTKCDERLFAIQLWSNQHFNLFTPRRHQTGSEKLSVFVGL